MERALHDISRARAIDDPLCDAGTIDLVRPRIMP